MIAFDPYMVEKGSLKHRQLRSQYQDYLQNNQMEVDIANGAYNHLAIVHTDCIIQRGFN